MILLVEHPSCQLLYLYSCYRGIDRCMLICICLKHLWQLPVWRCMRSGEGAGWIETREPLGQRENGAHRHVRFLFSAAGCETSAPTSVDCGKEIHAARRLCACRGISSACKFACGLSPQYQGRVGAEELILRTFLRHGFIIP